MHSSILGIVWSFYISDLRTTLKPTPPHTQHGLGPWTQTKPWVPSAPETEAELEEDDSNVTHSCFFFIICQFVPPDIFFLFCSWVKSKLLMKTKSIPSLESLICSHTVNPKATPNFAAIRYLDLLSSLHRNTDIFANIREYEKNSIISETHSDKIKRMNLIGNNPSTEWNSSSATKCINTPSC